MILSAGGFGDDITLEEEEFVGQMELRWWNDGPVASMNVTMILI